MTYRKFDSACFRFDIRSLSWDNIKTHDDLNDMWCVWENTFHNVADRHALCSAVYEACQGFLAKSPWITRELKQRMHKRNILKIKAIRSNDISDWFAFKKIRNSVNTDVKQYTISSQNSSYPSGITSYPTIHTHLHANQLNKGFNASVGIMNCGCVMR